MMFPWMHAKMVTDGLRAKFPDEVHRQIRLVLYP